MDPAQPTSLDPTLAPILLEQSPVGFCLLDNTGCIVWVNSFFLKLLGIEQLEYVVGANTLTLPAFQAVGMDQEIKEALTGVPFELEAAGTTMHRDTAVTLRYRGMPIENKEGAPKHIILIVDDVSHKKRLERDAQAYIKKLNEEQTRLLSSINSLHLGFLIVDSKNNILIKNNAIDTIIDSKELEGNIFLKKDIDVIQKQLGDVYNFEKKWEECIWKGVPIIDKEIAWNAKILRFYMAPILVGEKKEAHGVVVIIEDISDAKAIERSKDEFFSIASHELRTPLTAIRGNTSMIKQYYGDKLKETKELAEMIEDVHASSIRLIAIVNDFLNMGRLEQNRFVFKIEPLDLGKLIEEVVSEFKASSQLQNIYLKYEAPSPFPLPTVLADRDRIKQVLLNLVGNSIKFTEQGGVTILATQEGEEIKIRVKDTGHGVPAPYQHLLFRKFQQAQSSLFTRDTAKGTGLGLYISRLLVEGMKGKIYLESSEEGKGAVFALTLPIAPASNAAVPESNAAVAPQPSPPLPADLSAEASAKEEALAKEGPPLVQSYGSSPAPPVPIPPPTPKAS